MGGKPEAGGPGAGCLSLKRSLAFSVHGQNQIKAFKLLLFQMNPLPHPRGWEHTALSP